MGDAPLPAVKVLLADDHAIVRQALRHVLQANHHFYVVGEAADGRTAVRMALSLRPDVTLMDIAMPSLDGIEATRQIVRDWPGARVVLLTSFGDVPRLVEGLRAGARGYVLKRSDTAELALAVRAVCSGNTYVSHALAQSVDIAQLMYEARQATDGNETGLLSSREREILQLIVEGKTGREIARTIVLSEKTVEGHLTRIMAKLQARNRAELVRLAIQRRLVHLEDDSQMFG